MAWKHNGPPRTDHDASSAPTASDNASLGYSVGSEWTYDGTVYTLIRFDGTDAVWVDDVHTNEEGDLEANSLIGRHGPKAAIDDIVLRDGELAVTTDTYELRLGDGATEGGVGIPDTTIVSTLDSLAADFTLDPAGVRMIHVARTASGNVTSDTVTAISDGDYTGHLLKILVTNTDGSPYVITVKDGANTDLIGDWYSSASSSIFTWLEVVWDGSAWLEVGRGSSDGDGSGYLARSFIDGEATGNQSFAVLGEASGSQSIAIGDGCVADSANGVAIGNNAEAQASGAVAIGRLPWATAIDSCALNGGTAEGRDSLSTGSQSVAKLRGEHAHATGRFSARGDAQRRMFQLRGSTTDATQTELTSPERLAVLDEHTYAATVTIVGREDTGDAHYMAKRMVLIERTGGTTAIVGSAQTIGTDIDPDSWGGVAFSADNDALTVKVTGKASTNIRWLASVDFVDVGYSD